MTSGPALSRPRRSWAIANKPMTLPVNMPAGSDALLGQGVDDRRQSINEMSKLGRLGLDLIYFVINRSENELDGD